MARGISDCITDSVTGWRICHMVELKLKLKAEIDPLLPSHQKNTLNPLRPHWLALYLRRVSLLNTVGYHKNLHVHLSTMIISRSL